MADTYLAEPNTSARKGLDKFQSLLDNLNQQYGLGIHVSDQSISPREYQEKASRSGLQAQRAGNIQNRLRFFFFRNSAVLNEVLNQFHLRASNIHKGWLDKPGTERRSFPTPQGPRPFQAISGAECHELQTILHDLLEEALDIHKPLDRSLQGTSYVTTLGARQRPHKRISDEHHPQVSARGAKRSRQREGDADGLDAVPVRTRTDASPSTTAVDRSTGPMASAIHRPRGSHHVFCDRSAYTSNITLGSSVLSQPSWDEEAAQNTQTTVEADSQERRREEVLIETQSSSRQYDASSDIVEALEESFSAHEKSFRQSDDEVSPDPHVNNRIAGLCELDAEADVQNTDSMLSERLDALKDRLKNIWPRLPPFLNHAPLVVCWEFIRIATHCGVKLEHLAGLCYSDSWLDQFELRRVLQRHSSFQGKSFPEACPEATWAASNGNFEARGSMSVSLVVDLSWNTAHTGPLFHISLQPLKLELGHRLSRRFGSDRFLEFNFPSPTAIEVPPQVKKLDGAINAILKWLTTEKHFIAGRQWAAFFTKNTEKIVAEAHKGSMMGREGREATKTRLKQCRVYCFAEDGHSFSPSNHIPTKADVGKVNERTKMKLAEMLEWTISLSKSLSQPSLKLFSRIALSLSRTHPTIVFEPKQILHRERDILSPTNKVMNDGIARMSARAARLIRDELGLTDTPSAYQGRFGSAKGVWVVDATNLDNDIWIETYPSQRKWECDFLDEGLRTFEVKTEARSLKVASLNMQFIPVLEAQAIRPTEMRKAIKESLEKTIREELFHQRLSMEHPVQFRRWIDTNFNQGYRIDRLRAEHVTYVAGLPASEPECVNMLLDSGFHPKYLSYLRNASYNMARRMCEAKKSKMMIKVGRSAYTFMVADFDGVLEEGEIHLGFSSKFQDPDGEFSDTLLHGMDVLVARAPAHFPSDIQRVRAVFKPELRSLKDVVVFSTKGDSPLADLLSGGDYDGDQAWVCWDPTIVNNFQNSNYPPVPDLFALGYLTKLKGTFEDLMLRNDRVMVRTVTDFMLDSFTFNMEDQLLGICTIYKERLCYRDNSIKTDAAIALSTLVGHLVDQAKQGIVFGRDQWIRFSREQLRERSHHLPEPRYKSTEMGLNTNQKRSSAEHVLDYLKFSVALPLIEKELGNFDKMLGTEAVTWDKDLAGPFDEFERIMQTSESSSMTTSDSCVFREIKQYLTSQLEAVRQQWRDTVTAEYKFTETAQKVYERWQAIEVPPKALGNKEIDLYLRKGSSSLLFNNWALLKASTTFKTYHQSAERFVWNIAGRQLAWIKALSGTKGQSGPIAVAPYMYAILRPDPGLVKGIMAKKGSTDGQSVGIDDVEYDEEGAQMDDA